MVSSINAWFARVVYERDEWDETLVGWSSDEHLIILTIGWFSRLAVWLSRRALWVLLHVAHLFNMIFLRQREYDADRYEARMVGAETFAQTSRRLRDLQLATRVAQGDLVTSWQERRLPDNFPKLIVASLPQLSKETLAEYGKVVDQTKTRLFDTHPSDRNRIARARAEAPGNGIFHLDGPASDVFRNFDATARAATFDFYRALLGRDITKSQLFPVSELVETQQAVQEGCITHERFFLKALPLTERFALPLEYPKPPADPKAAKQALIAARRDQEAAREASLAAQENQRQPHERLLKAEMASILLRAGVEVRAEMWGLHAPTIKAAESAHKAALEECRALEEQIAPYAEAAARRLGGALALLELEAVADRIADGRQRREEARAIYSCTALLGANVASQLVSIVRFRLILEHLMQWSATRRAEEGDPFMKAVLRAAGILHEHLERVRRKVGDTIDYPFQHADEGISLGRFAFGPAIPDQSNVFGLLAAAEAANDRLSSLYARALGRLTVTAEEVERALGLEPIVVDE
jgi:Peptidase family M48